MRRATSDHDRPDSFWNRFRRSGEVVGELIGFSEVICALFRHGAALPDISKRQRGNQKRAPSHSRTPAQMHMPWNRSYARFPLLRLLYEAGLTVTSNSSLTSLPSGSFAVTVMVAVPVPVPTTVSVVPSTHIDATR